MQKMPTQRQLRVGEVVRQAISELIARDEIYATGVSLASVTITQVALSPDLKNATVFMMPLGGQNQQKTLQALQGQADYIRTILSKKIYLRYVPRLHFRLDDSFDKAGRVNEILNRPEVRRDVVAGEEGI